MASILKVYNCFDPVVRLKAKEVTKADKEIQGLIEDMMKTMYAAGGVGLAAPQIGKSLQIIVCCPTFKQGEELVLLNPVIQSSQGSWVFEEGCLSVPDIRAKVKRAKKVVVTGMDRKGNQVKVSADGMMARVLQHEIDHINGILFIDRLGFLKKKLVMRKLRPL